MTTKHLIIGVAIVAACAATCYFFFPRMNSVPVHRESYILDVTDTFRIQPEQHDIEHAFTWDRNKQGRTTRVRKITDIDQGDVYEFSLNANQIPGQITTFNFLSSDLHRGSEIESFDAEVWNTVSSFYNDSIGYQNTSLLMPLVEELVLLQEFKDDERVLLVYSDLNENREALSFLNTQTLKALQQDDISIWESVPGVESLKDLSGIKIYLIHRPMAGAEAEQYRIVSGYLKKRLESYGATVNIQGKVIHTRLGQP